MKPIIRKVKNARGHITGYAAQYGPIDVTASSPALAQQGAEADVRAALARLEQGASIHQWNGHLFIVSPTAYGWAYWIDTFSSMTYNCTQNGTREEAEDSALRHLAMNVWSHDVPDDTAFVATLPERMRADVASQLAWYREMARLMGRGYTDQEAREVIAGARTERAA